MLCLRLYNISENFLNLVKDVICQYVKADEQQVDGCGVGAFFEMVVWWRVLSGWGEMTR